MFNSIMNSVLSNSYVPSIFRRTSCEEKKIDFANEIPREITHEIFSYLNETALASCQRVNKNWQVLASHEDLWKDMTPGIACGKKEWEKYFGEIGLEPPLPENIRGILKSPCPFWPEKSVRETHMLVLIPETVNGKPLNLINLRELVKVPKEGRTIRFASIYESVINDYGNQSTGKSYWVLMTRNAIPATCFMNYTAKEVYINNWAKTTQINYEIPSVLEASICRFMHSISFKKRFSWLYAPNTCCKENIQNEQIVVGDFFWNSFDVFTAPQGYGFSTTALRKLG